MPISDARNKTNRHSIIQVFFWRNPGRRFRTNEIATLLNVSADTANRDLNELSGHDGPLPLTQDGWDWYLPVSAVCRILPLTLTLQEGTALYLAGRLLSEIRDGQNVHVLSALVKLLAAMPEDIVAHQQKIVDETQTLQSKLGSRPDIFGVLAQGWAMHRIVHLTYSPPKKQTFDCRFSPYMLEPSAIGHTIYAIGRSSVPSNALRTYRFERIDRAELTKEKFDVPNDFDGYALLKRAWGVMYGDEEPIKVVLQFSHHVTRRVKETLWHLSQDIVDVPDGCVMTVQIGDLLEIKNWIRGWGSDCEVKGPESLRKEMIREARRLARMYGVGTMPTVSPDEPDKGLLSNVFGG